MSHRKRLLVVCILVVLLVGGVVWYWRFYLNSSSRSMPKELRDAASRQEKLRLSDAEANKTNALNKATDEISQLITAKKYTEAKTKLDTLAKDQASNTAAQDTIYGLYVSVCAGLVDTTCMNITLDHFKDKKEAYFTVAVQFGEASAAAKKSAEAKKYYQLALTVANNNGGQTFVENINKADKERQYDYNQIKQAAS